MSDRFITDDDAEKALQWLIQNARPLGDAKEALVKAERLIDRTKAVIMKRHSDMPVSAQEREAKASTELEAAYLEEAKAAGHYEHMRALRDAAMARLDCWRTLRASERAMSK
jgi:hypothetical protein